MQFSTVSSTYVIDVTIIAFSLVLGSQAWKHPYLQSACRLTLVNYQLTAQTRTCTINQSSRAGVAMAAADAEIARFRDILKQIDDLETEFDKVRHIRDIVKGFRARVEGLEKRVDGKSGRRR